MDIKNTYQAGQKGESLVCKKLQTQGYKIIARNVHEKFAEIDIIARDPHSQTMVFIEVRTRQSKRLGHPAETINERKIRHIRRAAEAYLVKHKIRNCAIRFDVATIIWDENRYDYFENAF